MDPNHSVPSSAVVLRKWKVSWHQVMCLWFIPAPGKNNFQCPQTIHHSKCTKPALCGCLWLGALNQYLMWTIIFFPAEALFCYRTFSLATFVSCVIQQGLQTGSWPQGQLSEYPITIHNHLLKRVRKSNWEHKTPSRSLGMCSNKATHLLCN